MRLHGGSAKTRARDYLVLDPWWRPHVMAWLLAHALECGIEVAYVQSVIRRRAIRAESPDIENWPWPLKIYTLGQFVVLKDGEPLVFSRKAPYRLLAALKALIAFGSVNVSEAKLADVLSSDEGSDAALRLLATTVHRLRNSWVKQRRLSLTTAGSV